MVTAVMALIDARLATGHRTTQLWALDACATAIWACTTVALMRRTRTPRARPRTPTQPPR